MNTLRLEETAQNRLIANLLAEVDELRSALRVQSKPDKQKQMEQFLTPAPIAELMAELFQNLDQPEINLLDAGAGTGMLLAAVVQRVCLSDEPPRKMRIVAYEIDSSLIPFLESTLENCKGACHFAGIDLSYEIRNRDFVEDAVMKLSSKLLNQHTGEEFSHVITNPPYSKIQSNSRTRKLLRHVGLETTNIYTGFMALAALWLRMDGELVTITPRSFCNGTYFRPFRAMFLDLMSLHQIHTFESRSKLFSDDAVLQETIVLHCKKQQKKADTVFVTTSTGADDDMELCHAVPYNEVVWPDDKEQFIRILPDAHSQAISKQMESFTYSLQDLGISVSTGRVVDFRAREFLCHMPGEGTVPLIYPANFSDDRVRHPIPGRKPQAIVNNSDTSKILVPNGNYVLCKRFSSKEEKRRVVAAVYQEQDFTCEAVGFENHLNYFHQEGKGLEINLARGLALFLNSSLVDRFFRFFNGHTQVNVSDLQSLKYPARNELISLGLKVGSKKLTQQDIDQLIEEELVAMSNNSQVSPSNIQARISEALDVLKQLGFPKQQLNDRSALTLLALLNLTPLQKWEEATARPIGITPIMDFMSEHYGKKYKANTRETVRRQTVHQFLDASLIVINPDDPKRAVNSPKNVYQVEEIALELLRQYKTDEWSKALQTYLASVKTLKQKYAQVRKMARIPVIINGTEITLSPGGQNVLIKEILDQFGSRFTPDGNVLYVGDADGKIAHYLPDDLAELGINLDPHGKMPDIIIHFLEKDWLVLIEAVTSHGPINPKRKQELEKLFKDSKIPLVMVTAFLSRAAMAKYSSELAWETDVWLAEDSTHLIHFNGKHLLQIYDKKSDNLELE